MMRAVAQRAAASMGHLLYTLAAKFIALVAGAILAITGMASPAPNLPAQTASVALSEQTTAAPEQNAPASSFPEAPQQTSTPAAPAPSILYAYEPPAKQIDGAVTQAQLTAAMANITNALNAQLYGATTTLGGGGIWNSIAAANKINNLSNVTINNPIISGLAASSIPDLSSSYLSVNGGSLTGSLGIGTSSPADTFALNGAAYLADIAVPSNTTNRLDANAGNLYWAGAALSGGGVSFTATSGILFSSSQLSFDSHYSGGRTLDSYLQAGDTDYTNALTRALTASTTLYIEATSTPYQVRGTFTVPSGMKIIAKGNKPVLHQNTAGTATLFNLSNSSAVQISGIAIDETGVSGTGPVILMSTTTGAVIDVDISNAPSSSLGSILLTGASTKNTVTARMTSVAGICVGLSGIGVQYNTITGGQFTDCSSFGIRGGEGANRNLIENNTTYRNGIELVGMTAQTSYNRIIGNHAEGTGDDGISVSGDHTLVANNTTARNYYSGIGIWGSFNTVMGNTCIDNDQSLLAGWAGIDVMEGFGGAGQYNTITGNACDDDQASPTQYNSIRIRLTNAYTTWSAGQSVTAGTYETSGLNIYQAATSGTTGGSAPTCTSGTCSDGAVTWTYFNTFISAAQPLGNIVEGNSTGRSSTGIPFADTSGSWSLNQLSALGFLSFPNLPIVSTGLSAAQVWNDAGLLAIGTSTGFYASSTNFTTFGGMGAGAGIIANATSSSNTSAPGSTAFGYTALGASTATGINNSAFGYKALLKNTTGANNSAFGQAALANNTGGIQNNAIGQNALVNNTSGSNNIAEGVSALLFNQTGSSNTAVGVQSGQGVSNNSFSNNSLFGYKSGFALSTGSQNVFLGAYAASTTASGSNNIAIGYDIALPSANGSNQLNIGNLLFGTGLNGEGPNVSTGSIAIGTSSPAAKLTVWGTDTASTSAFTVANSASTTVFAIFNNGNSTYAGSLFQSSDRRLKTNIVPLDASSSLTAIQALEPVSYDRIDQPGTGENLGFIAQAVQAVFPELVSTTSPTVLTPGGTLTLNYTGLIAPIIAAIKALAADLAYLKATVAGFAASFTSHFIHGDTIEAGTLCLKDDSGSTCYTRAQLNASLASAAQETAQPAALSTTTAPEMQINGNNPAIVAVGATYSDLGATIVGPAADINLGIQTYVNGAAMSPISIDTNTAATNTVEYVVVDASGITSTSTRTVIVQGQNITASSTEASSTQQ